MNKLTNDELNKKLQAAGFDYITVVDFKGTAQKSKFYDKDFGEYEAYWYATIQGRTKHKQRTALLKNQEMINKKREQTLLNKYGVTNCSQLESSKVKKEQTNLKKRNVKNPMQSKEIQEKALKTKGFVFDENNP